MSSTLGRASEARRIERDSGGGPFPGHGTWGTADAAAPHGVAFPPWTGSTEYRLSWARRRITSRHEKHGCKSNPFSSAITRDGQMPSLRRHFLVRLHGRDVFVLRESLHRAVWKGHAAAGRAHQPSPAGRARRGTYEKPLMSVYSWPMVPPWSLAACLALLPVSSQTGTGER